MPAARETPATMKAATRARLAAMGFRDQPFPGTMHLVLAGIDGRAVLHPWNGLALMFNYAEPRRVAEGETFLPEDASIPEIARALARAVEAIHSPGGYTGS